MGFAKLAEQAERYDEMAKHMQGVGTGAAELSVEERNLLSVAYKNAVGSRRASWRIISSIEQKEKSKGNTDQAGYALEYRQLVEQELQKICGRPCPPDGQLDAKGERCRVEGLLPQDEGRLLPLHRGIHE